MSKKEKSKGRKGNAFVAFQIAAAGTLTASGAVTGFVTGNWGRAMTGGMNTTRNVGWYLLHRFLPVNGGRAIDRDIAATGTNVMGASAAAATNVPQLIDGIQTAVETGAIAGNPDLMGASMGVLAYSLMAGDQFWEWRRLDRHRDEHGEEHYDKATRDHIVGYKERGDYFQEVMFNVVPPALLFGRAASFTAGGASEAELVSDFSNIQNFEQFTQALTNYLQNPNKAAALLLCIAGVLFMVGAIVELRKQNSVFRQLPSLNNGRS